MKNFLNKFNKKQWLLLATNALMLLGFFIVTILSSSLTKELYSQQQATRWAGKKGDYVQVSAFLSKEEAYRLDNISGIRSVIAVNLKEASLDEQGSKGRVWIDTYSGESEIQIRKDNNTLEATVIGVGGEFFQFHPLQLLSGSYISEEDLNTDRIVIDEGLAWKIFGSNNVQGMQVWIEEQPYFVAGVVKMQEDQLHTIAYGAQDKIYMHYSHLESMKENLVMTCYEAVLPNPVSNFAYYTLREAFGLPEELPEEETQKNKLNFDGIEVIENTSRYTVGSLLKTARDFHLRAMKTNSIAYPYWENVAKTVGDYKCVLLMLQVLLLVFPVTGIIYVLIQLWKHRKWHRKDILNMIISYLEKLRVKEEDEDDGEGRDEEDGKEENDEGSNSRNH